ncbi:MAG: AarF/ABC1/UbiB kinase family protein [Candidatus Eisenbacteria bacterium]|uniref:AarF/ABC1/UbiB kinase family protein n=1 Tax=Eiseniibacteriota bacterium TaxID=2212470 RepID=A0A7Y2H1M3_UNCEI|nr:AarF/ABC1/UbiB kinase family protein [Candidatus Eisenbacteria bacterium]
MSPKSVGRYKDIAKLAVKYGGWHLAARLGLAEQEGEGDKDAPPVGKPEELVLDLEALGPSYVKLGQALSSRADILPKPYIEALSKLHDSVEPFPFEKVREIVESELGVKISSAFDEFEEVPAASASLGQVHRATLRDGRRVVVKVQRPDVHKTIVEDFDAFASIAGFFDKHTETGQVLHTQATIEQFRTNILQELDYRTEARNLKTLGRNLMHYDLLVVPQPIPDYVSQKVLTMDRIEGTKLTDLSPVVRLEIDGEELADELFKAYLQQILVDGFFHADPHPGNVFITRDHRVALLDLGMVGRVSDRSQERLLQIVLAASEGKGDKVAEAAIDLGKILDNADEDGFHLAVVQLVNHTSDQNISQVGIGEVLLKISSISAEHGIRPTPSLALLGKTLLHLDQLAATLAPTFDPGRAVQTHASGILKKRTLKSFSPSHILSSALETKELLENLPRRANTVMDRLASNEFSVRVDAIDEASLLEGAQKIANRITAGLVLAALIIGAALLMPIESKFQLFGYPGLAIILFVGAAILGFRLVISIMLNDISSNKKK